jgi:hypothetical protein
LKQIAAALQDGIGSFARIHLDTPPAPAGT